MRKKTVWMAAGAVLALAVCMAGLCRLAQSPKDKPEKAPLVREAPVSSLEQFAGTPYDAGRQQPKDMTELTGKDQEKQGTDQGGEKKRLLECVRTGSEKKGAWYALSEKDGGEKIRYYETDTRYALGWRLLRRNGKTDWYYFDEDTGGLVTNTTVDGAVLDSEGRVRAAAASDARTLKTAGSTAHCREILLLEDIKTEETLDIKKEMTYLTASGKAWRISPAKQFPKQEPLLKVQEGGAFCIGTGVSVDTGGSCAAAVAVERDGSFDCFGQAGNFSGEESGTGILGMSADSRIGIYDGAVVTGSRVGIENRGITVLAGGSVTANGIRRVISPGQTITGRDAHGICQRGGMLVMTGGTIWNNGQLGSASGEGSSGGGVLLLDGAVMEMSGGAIAANRAAAGGGIYVSAGCTLSVTGGRIGGSKSYYKSAKSNTPFCGNYARESSAAAYGKRYRGGEGGGIYSLGTVKLDGKRNIQIRYNCAKGAGGGGGINAAKGSLYLTGNVSVSDNRAVSSEASDPSLLYGGGDANAEGGGIRIGQERGSSARYYINWSSAGEKVRAGTVQIEQNTASGDGGGIFVSSAPSNLLMVKGNTSVEKNQCGAGGGGGVKSLGGSLFLDSVRIAENQAKEASHGGGVLTAGKTVIKGCEIFGNRSVKSGGGICFYDSTVGTSAKGSITDTKVYANTAAADGAGIMISSTKDRVTADGVLVYQNGGTGNGIRCASGSRLLLKQSGIWGNGRYGVSNGGKAVLGENVQIGYRTDGDPKQYREEKNQVGGIYNTGEITVTDKGGIYVYGGDGWALRNRAGTVMFEAQSESVLTGSGCEKIVENTGKLIARKDEQRSEGPVQILGEDAVYGIYNSAGTVIWNGCIGKRARSSGVPETADEKHQSLAWGIYNANAGTVEIQEKGRVDSCKTGVQIQKGTKLLLTGGEILDCGVRGIFAQTGSTLEMEGNFYADKDSVVFLGEGTRIYVTGPLTGARRPAAVLDTQKGKDRNPGRILVSVLISGKTGGDILGQEANQSFGLAYAALDTGEEALLRGAEGLSKDADPRITKKDIILSARYRVSYDSGYRLISGASASDIRMSQKEQEKYWMEDLTLDLAAPRLVNEELMGKNWTFRYWEGTDHLIYTGSEGVYRKNEDLLLKACWKRDYTCRLEGWLYSRSGWLRGQMKGSKEDENYKHFLAGDTGIIGFRSRNIESVRILWPDTADPGELKTYDRSGSLVKDQTYDLRELTEDLDQELYWEHYRFRVPADTPAGTYQVQILGRTVTGEQIGYPLVLYVDDGKITGKIRTRIR